MNELPFVYPAQPNFVSEIQPYVLSQFKGADHEPEVCFALSRPNFVRLCLYSRPAGARGTLRPVGRDPNLPAHRVKNKSGRVMQ